MRLARQVRITVHEACELVLAKHADRAITEPRLDATDELLTREGELIIGSIGSVRAKEHGDKSTVLF